MPVSKKNYVAPSPFRFLAKAALVSVWVAALVLLLPAFLAAQDSRTVTEPTFPPTCTALTANQVAGSLDEANFDTSRIQTALNACPAGQAVELQAQSGNNAFLIQPLTLPSGVTLLVDAEVTVFTSLNRGDYPCPSSSSSDCTPIITVSPGSGSGIMGYGIIDGRGGNSLNGETVSWWTQTPLDPRPRMIQLVNADNFTLYKITLQNSPKFHVFGTGNFLTVWDVKITAPTTSPNTDGIDPSGSHDITITNSFISDGDDHIAIKAGVGHVSNVTISNNRLYQGHGVSIGSETNAGAENVLVTDFVMDGAVALNQNVIRIKTDSSKGGEVKNITYQNICARNPGHPLVFNPFNSSSTGTLFPNVHDIVVHNMHVLNRQNSSTVEGYSNSSGVNFPLGITLNNVALDGFKTTGTPDFPATQVNHVNFTLGPDPVTPVSPGVVSIINGLAAVPANQVTVVNNVSNSNPPFACTPGSFVYLAGELFAPPNDVTVDSGGQTVTLSAIVQPIVSGAAAPTGTINILEGTNVVGSATVSGRITPVAIANVSNGPHTYTAQYSGDTNYALLNFGSVTILDTTTVVTPSASSIVYGNSLSLTANVTAASGTPSGSLTFEEAGSPLNTATLNAAGTATFSVGVPSAGAHSYSADYAGGSGFEASNSDPAVVTVAPAPLTITADNKSMTFGDPVPALTYTRAGFVNGDTAAVLSGSPSLTTGATSSSPAGTYPIVPAIGTLAAANYAFSFVNGTLTINPATPTVTVNCPAVTFDGSAHACTAAATGVGGAAVNGTFTITYNGSTTAPVNAGTYAVSVNFVSGDPSYVNASGTGILVIAQATPLVTVRCPDVHFNHHRHACDVDVFGVNRAQVSGTLVVTYNGDTQPPFAVGTYAVAGTFTSADPNYTNATGTGTLTITRGHHDGDEGGDGDDRDHHDDGDRGRQDDLL